MLGYSGIAVFGAYWLLISFSAAQGLVITSVFPATKIESPISFGIDITLIGTDLDQTSGKLACENSTSINLTKNEKNSDSTAVHLKTNSDTSSRLGMTCSLVLLKNDVPIDISNWNITVTFVDDPRVNGLWPKVTTLRGGIPITINGSNFIYPGPIVGLFSICNEGEPTLSAVVVCGNPTRNRSRYICTVPNLHGKLPKQCPYSDSVQHSIYELRFVLGEPTKAEILVVQDITVTRWEYTRVFKPYKGHRGIDQLYATDIEGIFSPYIDDQYYTATVGNQACTDLRVFVNSISCRLPGEKPTGGVNPDGTYTVKLFLGNQNLSVGSLRYEINAWEDPTVKYGVIGGACGLVVLVILIPVFIWRVRRYSDHKKLRRQNMMAELTEEERERRRRIYQRRINAEREIWPLLEPELKSKLETNKKDKERMDGANEIKNQVGEGNFGTVYRGTFRRDDGSSCVVAIKACKGVSEFNDKVDFLEEAAIMVEFDHPHVLSLIAVIIDGMNPYVVLPYMENGDLKHYIKDKQNPITVRQLVRFALDVSRGMSYLADRKFVHRDLAARNVMLDQDMTAVVADFGLARDIYVSNYYCVKDRTRPLPIKSMAVETLFGHPFTTASDVWSFGVLLWELLTRGLRLYADTPATELKFRLQSGYRLQKPSFAPEEIYTLMSYCWLADPSKRPTFADLIVMMEDLIDESAITKNLSVNVRKASLSSDYADITGRSKSSEYSEYLQMLHSTPPVPLGDI